MEYKKTRRKRTLNEYRQVKDNVYKNPTTSLTSNRYLELIENIKKLCKQYPADEDLGGAVRRIIKKHDYKA